MTATEFKETYIPHKLKLFRVANALLCHSEDAEDAVQETYIKLWKMKESLDTITNSEAYSVTMVKNISLDILRSKSRKGYNVSIDEVQISDDTTAANEGKFEAQNQLVFVSKWLDTLPREQKMVFIHRHKQGMSVREIAELLQLSESNVKVILSRLRKRLKEELQTYE